MMILIRVLLAATFESSFSSVFALKLRTKETSISEISLSPCLQKAVVEAKQMLSQSSKITIQATCHAYSGVTLPVSGGKRFSVMQCNAFSLDEASRIASIEPGTRYLDVVPSLRKAHLFMPHGNYGGQTIIGLLATGTHGTGQNAPHNFISEVTVLNGLGMLKRVTQTDAEMSAWQNHIGVLGVVLTAKLGPLLPEYHIETVNVQFDSILAAGQSYVLEVANGKTLGWVNCVNNSVVRDTVSSFCVNVERSRTEKPLSKQFEPMDGTGCCASAAEVPYSGVFSSVDGDLYTSIAAEPAKPESVQCYDRMKRLNDPNRWRGMKHYGYFHNPFKQLQPAKHFERNYREVGYEIELGEADMVKLINLVPSFVKCVGQPWGDNMDSKLTSHWRHVPMDFKPPLLSPYKYSPMFNVEFYLGDADETTEEEVTTFLQCYETLNNQLRLLGSNFRLHPGKGGVGNLFTGKDKGDNTPAVPMWDMYAFNYWKKLNDPQNLFTNQKWETWRGFYNLG